VSGWAGVRQRIRATAGALRYPWPAGQASIGRLVLLFLGATSAAMPGDARWSSVLWRALALQACALSGFFATVLLNDVADRDLDRIAHPERPLARGTVRPGDAVALCALLYAVTLGAAWLLGTLLFLLVLFWLVVPVIGHYFVFKRGRRPPRSDRGPAARRGSFYSDLITPVQFAGLGVLVYLGFQHYDLPAMVLLAGIIYLGDASLNVLQAIRDQPGDAADGVSTVAVRHGPRNAGRVALALHVCLVPFALAYAWRAHLGLTFAAGALLVCLMAALVLRPVVARPEPRRVARAIVATTVTLQLLLIGLGAVRVTNHLAGAGRPPARAVAGEPAASQR
jgi:4-hydroxybenzoate polyprenyltransferase